MRRYRIIILGAGLLGCFTARHLAMRGYRVAVLERENDVCMGMSRANTAIVYAGYDMRPGTLKARLTVECNAAFDDLCKRLGVAFERTGSLMIARGPRGAAVLDEKLRQGQRNGVPGLRLLGQDEVKALEPELSADVVAALYSPTTGTVTPWELCLAAARSAADQGADFLFGHEAVKISPVVCDDMTTHYQLRCSNGNDFHASVVVNCTGNDADRTNELAAPAGFRLMLSSGSYLILDTEGDACLRHVIFSEPEEKGKGATLVPTVDGTLMLGPSHEDLDSASSKRQAHRLASLGSSADRQPPYPTRAEGMEFVRSQSLAVCPKLPMEQTIRSFGTLRPNIKETRMLPDGSIALSTKSIPDLYIAWAEGIKGFLNLAGIKTPGLTCADGIGRYAADMVESYLAGPGPTQADAAVAAKVSVAVPSRMPLRENPYKRHAADGSSLMAQASSDASLMPYTDSTSHMARAVGDTDHTAENDGSSTGTPRLPDFPVDGPARWADTEILCRCRLVTAGEVRAAVNSKLGARTIDGIKRRTGCGSGRCQGSFCTERIMLVLARELGCRPADLAKDRSGSWIIRERAAAAAVPPGQAHDGSSSALVSTGRGHGTVFQDSAEQKDSDRRATCERVRLLVVGGGGAGLMAACSAAEAGLSPEEILLVDRLDALGGILPQCTHHGFGARACGGTLSGPEFLAPLLEEFLVSGIPARLSTTVMSVTPQLVVSLAGPSGFETLAPEALVLATGCRERPIGSLPVAGTRPSGIFTAGAAQRMINLRNWDIGERIVILGSGDVGMIMAGALAGQGKEVLAIVERENAVGGLQDNRERYVDAYGIPVLTGRTVTRVFGHRRIEGVEIGSASAFGDGESGENTISSSSAATTSSAMVATGAKTEEAGREQSASQQRAPKQPLPHAPSHNQCPGFRGSPQAFKKPLPPSPCVLACDTLIVSVGLIPEADLLQESARRATDALLSRYREDILSALPSLQAPGKAGLTGSTRQDLPSRLFIAGNARRVHRYIEGVVADGKRAGRLAAACLANLREAKRQSE